MRCPHYTHWAMSVCPDTSRRVACRLCVPPDTVPPFDRFRVAQMVCDFCYDIFTGCRHKLRKLLKYGQPLVQTYQVCHLNTIFLRGWSQLTFFLKAGQLAMENYEVYDLFTSLPSQFGEIFESRPIRREKIRGLRPFTTFLRGCFYH